MIDATGQLRLVSLPGVQSETDWCRTGFEGGVKGKEEGRRAVARLEIVVIFAITLCMVFWDTPCSTKSWTKVGKVGADHSLT